MRVNTRLFKGDALVFSFPFFAFPIISDIWLKTSTADKTAVLKYHRLWDSALWKIKGVDKKTSHLNSCFAHISASIHQIFKILVPTPHN